MASRFYTLVTDIGADKIAKAAYEDVRVVINSFAVGDGGGVYVEPVQTQTALVKEVYRGTISSYSIVDNTIKVIGIIPASVGGFTVREAGLFDDTGALIAVANISETEKVDTLDGINCQLQIALNINISNDAKGVVIKCEDMSVQGMKELIEAAKLEIYNRVLKPGTIRMYAGATIPDGYLPCTGAAISRTSYAGLFAAIGTTYGSGDGVNSFNLPNFIGKFAQGAAAAGAEKAAGLPNITGKVNPIYCYVGLNAEEAFALSEKGTKGINNTIIENAQQIIDSRIIFDASKSNAIYGASETVQPPALEMIYIIKY